MAMIVVGVDGSTSAKQALSFAVQEATLRDARLRAVAGWHMSTMGYEGVGFGPDIDPSIFDMSAAAALEAALDALGERANGLEIERVVRMGGPAEVLVEEARSADLLVVGSRGHGGFVGLLLGSVSHQCAMHASCPVVIVRSPA